MAPPVNKVSATPAAVPPKAPGQGVGGAEAVAKTLAAVGEEAKAAAARLKVVVDPPIPVRKVRAKDFVKKGPAELAKLGEALLPSNVEITGLQVGKPLLFSRGSEITEANMPEGVDDYCDLKARGIVFVPKKGVVNRLHEALADPKNHPELLVGIESSKDVKKFGPKDFSLPLHVHNHQISTTDIQFFTDINARRVPNGVTYGQVQLKSDEWKPYHSDYKEAKDRGKKIDDLRGFIGHIQFLEIHNGTVIIMEMRARSPMPEDPLLSIDLGCGMAADSGSYSERGVKQRITARLEKFAELAMR